MKTNLMLTRSSAIGNTDDVRLQYGTCNTVSLLEQVKAVQQQHFLPLQLVTVVSGHSHLQNLDERHSILKKQLHNSLITFFCSL